MKTQEELFEHIKLLALKVDSLKGIVQNDFQRMLKDGMITYSDLLNGLKEAGNSFDRVIEELQTTNTEILQEE